MANKPFIMSCLVFIALWTRVTQAQQDPQPPISLADKDDPQNQYKLKRPEYVGDMKNSIESDYYQCVPKEVIRNQFGSKDIPDAESIPMFWSQLSIAARTVAVPIGSFFIQMTKFWPDIIMPFLFCLMSVGCAIVLIIPILLVGGIFWAFLYNLRLLANKKIRLAIRSLLIKKEKCRRWYYRHCYPPQHLRKFLERDRYQMPETFQHPDLSSDDEPEELERHHIPRKKTTMWTKKEIKMLGFDPDNIPLEKIYGDLLGSPDKLAPEVRDYVKRKKASERDNDNEDNVSLTSDEWADALRSKVHEIKSHSHESTLKHFWSKMNSEASELFHASVLNRKKSSKKISSDGNVKEKEAQPEPQEFVKQIEKPKRKPAQRPSVPAKVPRMTGKKSFEKSISSKERPTATMPPPPKFWVSRKSTPVPARTPSPVKLDLPKEHLPGSNSSSPTQLKVANQEKPPQKPGEYTEKTNKRSLPKQQTTEVASKAKTSALPEDIEEHRADRASGQEVRTSLPRADPNPHKEQNRASLPKGDTKLGHVFEDQIFSPKTDPILKKNDDIRASQPHVVPTMKQPQNNRTSIPKETPNPNVEEPTNAKTSLPKEGLTDKRNKNSVIPPGGALVYTAGKNVLQGTKDSSKESSDKQR